MILCPPNVRPIQVQARGVTLIENIDRQGQPCTGLDGDHSEGRSTVKGSTVYL